MNSQISTNIGGTKTNFILCCHDLCQTFSYGNMYTFFIKRGRIREYPKINKSMTINRFLFLYNKLLDGG